MRRRMAELSGKAVAITGASSGIGEATALTLAKAGASVALGARRKDRIDALAARIEDEGGTAVPLEVDVTDEAQARAFVESAHDRLGRLDSLVNNAGVMLLGPVEQADSEQWRTMINVNVLGLLYCTSAALPIMRAQGSGDIVNISSVAGRFARAGNAVYAATKFAVGAFSEGLRNEVTEGGIRVTLIEPGMVDTELQSHNEGEVLETLRGMREQIGEILRAQDVANGILYAVSQPPHVSINEVLIRPTRQTR
jgi:NADP-dependent 3-hydroxy acid dehydrogenase YdfG